MKTVSYTPPPFTMENVVDWSGIWVQRRWNNQMQLRCPFCEDKKAHLNVNLTKGVFRCSRCGLGGGPLQFWATLKHQTTREAYKDLCERAGQVLRGKPEPPRNDSAMPPAAVPAPAQTPALRPEKLDAAYRGLLDQLILSEIHREKLLARGLLEQDLERLQYRSVPMGVTEEIAANLLQQGIQLEGVPGFFQDPFSGDWRLDVRGSGILVPDRDAHGWIEALQVRMDDTSSGKFLNFTSADRNHGTQTSCCPHFAGVVPGMSSVLVTEGVMKADVARSLSVQLGRPLALVGLTGVANFGQFRRAIGELQQMQIHKVYLAFDMDAAVNENVRRARDKVMEMGAAAGLEMALLSWNPAYKGIDDLLLADLKKMKKIA